MIILVINHTNSMHLDGVMNVTHTQQNNHYSMYVETQHSINLSE